MSTSVNVKTYELFEGFQDYSCRLTHFPLQWDPFTKQFSFSSSLWKIKWFCLVNFLLLGFQCVVSASLVMLRLLTNDTPDSVMKFSWVLSLFLGGWLAICLVFALLRTGHKYTVLMNRMILLERYLANDGFISNSEAFSSKYKQTKGSSSSSYKIFPSLFVLCPIACIPSSLLEINPVQQLYLWHLPTSVTSSLFLRILLISGYILIGCWAIFETFRLIGLIYILPCVQLRYCLNALDILHSNFKAKNTSKYWGKLSKLYEGISIVQSYRWDFAHGLDYCLYLIGQFSAIMCSYFTIVVYPLVPPYIYVMFPTFALGVLAAIHFVMPQVAKLHGNSKVYLREWIQMAMRQGNKFYCKRFRGFRPLTVGVGLGGVNLIYIEKDTKAGYYAAINHITIDLVLAYPLESVKRTLYHK